MTGFWIPPELCVDRMAALIEAQKLLKFLLQENINKEESWDNELISLLCEYYTAVRQQLNFFLELTITDMTLNERTNKEEFFISKEEALLLKSLNALMQVNDVDLKLKHQISLILH